jgi:hypothetical protein
VRYHKVLVKSFGYGVGTVAPVVIPVTWKAEIRIIAIGGQLGQKLCETLPSAILTNKLGMVVHACHPSFVGCVNRRIKVQAGPGEEFETLVEK